MKFSYVAGQKRLILEESESTELKELWPKSKTHTNNVQSLKKDDVIREHNIREKWAGWENENWLFSAIHAEQ